MERMTRRQADSRKGRSGWTWPGLLVAACAASGCLIRQEDTLLQEVPEFMNRPPRIIETQVKPRERITRDFGANGCDLFFEVAVEDPDVGDRIVVSWYVDYNPQDPQGPYRQYVLEATGEALRTDRGSLTISLASANNPLGTPGPHLVEALVSDTALVDREPQARQVVQLPDGGTLVDPGYVASYAWVVNTVQGDCR
jgi:hypothetical protein